MNIVGKLFRRLSGPALNPARAATARRDFDQDRGFDRYLAYCQSAMQRPIPEGGDALSADGVEVVPILSQARAAEAWDSLSRSASGTKTASKGIDYSFKLTFDDPLALMPLFEEILNPDVDARFLRFFGSEYMIYSFDVIRNPPNKSPRRSFLWHCDRGPWHFAKILLYLNGTEEHGGSTEFVIKSQTQEFERIGYVFGPNKRRVSDLRPLARRHGFGVTPACPTVKAGEGVLLLPASVLHRGLMPNRGERHMLSIMFMPSPVHWRQAFVAAARTRFCETNNASWLPTADALLEVIDAKPPAGVRFAA